VCTECGEREAKGRGLCGTCRYRLDPVFREKHKAAMRRAKAANDGSAGKMIECSSVSDPASYWSRV
jgi:hypothetical protein